MPVFGAGQRDDLEAISVVTAATRTLPMVTSGRRVAKKMAGWTTSVHFHMDFISDSESRSHASLWCSPHPRELVNLLTI